MHTSLSTLASATLLVSLAGCTSMPTAGPDAIHTFAAATSATGTAVGGAFEMVNQSYYSAQGAAYLADFDRSTSPPELKDFLSPAAIDARVTVLDNLASYAALLVDIADNDRSAELGTASSALADTLQGFRPDGAADISTGLASAIHGIGKVFTSGRRFDGIASAASAADPHVQRICTLLAEDIAALRAQLAADNAKNRQEEFRYLKESLAAEKARPTHVLALDAARRRQEIERLVDIARAGKTADRTLADLATMVGDLAVAHKAIAEAYGKSASALQKSQSFFNAAQRLRHLYSPSTPAKG